MQDENRFNDSIKKLLDRDLEELEPGIAQRLQQARMQALDAVAARRYINPYSNWRTAGALALGVMLLLAVVFWPNASQHGVNSPLDSDMELFAADDNLQLYEDLEFYEWLLASDSQAG